MALAVKLEDYGLLTDFLELKAKICFDCFGMWEFL